MQYACITPRTSPAPLPDIDDPSLTAPIIHVPDPDAEYDRMMAALEAETCAIPAWPDTPKGHLAALLPYERGRKLISCRNGGFIYRYADGSRAWRPMYPCNDPCCPDCSEDRRKAEFDKYQHLESFLQGHKFTRITVLLPADMTPRIAITGLMNFLKQSLPKAATLAKVKPISDRVEILYCGGMPEGFQASLRLAYPAAVCRQHCQSNFLRELDHVLTPEASTSPEATVMADAKYHKTRLLRLQGLTQAEREKLLHMSAIRNNFSPDEDEPIPGDGSGGCGGGFSSNSDPPPPEKYYHRTSNGHLMSVPACPCGCGAGPTHFARGKSAEDNSPDLEWYAITLVTESQRIHEAKMLKESMVMLQ